MKGGGKDGFSHDAILVVVYQNKMNPKSKSDWKIAVVGDYISDRERQ